MVDVIRVRDGRLIRTYLKKLTQEELDLIIVPKKGANIGQQVKINDGKSHRLNIKVEYKDKATKEVKKEWFACGTTNIRPGDPTVMRRKVNDSWITINPEAIIDFNATPNGTYNAKMILSTFDLIQNGPEQESPFIYKANEASNNKPNTTPVQKKDLTGMWVGHGLKGGCKALNKFDVKKILELSKNVHDLTKKLDAEYKSILTGMSDFDRGQSVGCAILCACKFGGSIGVIEANTRELLSSVVPPLTSYIKGEVPKEKPVANIEGSSDIPPSDDIPF